MGPLHDQLIAPQPRSVLPEDGSDKLLDSYYYNAFVAHPFVLPQGHFARFKNNSMQVVVATMRWIGSLYLDTHVGARDGLYEEAHRLIYSPSTPRDGFLVQAMMLLLVALDGCSQQRKAVQVLEDAEQLALEIGLHSREFASRHGCNVPALEESWRRTWWDLYIIDGMIAGVHRVTSFALYDVVADVLLPCEEHQYLSGVSTWMNYLSARTPNSHTHLHS